MAVVNGMFKPLVALFGLGNAQPVDALVETEPAVEDEQAFLASIVHLPADEQWKRIQARTWYARLAQRQGIIEAEHQAAQALLTSR